MNKKKTFLIFFVFIFLILNAKKAYSPQELAIPFYCQDSDGDCDVENLKYLDGNSEMVDFLTYPFGWIITSNFNSSIPEGNDLDSARIKVYWYTDVDFGATNINIDYWNGNSWVNCAGPFSENESLTETICDVSSLSRDQITNLKVRFRGEDYDGFPNAFGYVDAIQLEINYSSPPKWANLTANNFVFYGDSINLSVQLYDDVGLSHAWLSTNETGEWKNYSGIYNSPVYLNNTSNNWIWVNFTWKNASITSGIVAWKICFNDTTSKENCTDERIFYVQFRMMPTYCQDSDGDCDVENLKYLDGNSEMVDFLTYPFGWILTSNWNYELPENILIESAKIVIHWYTDVDFGATNINIDYWNGNSWVNCAGPFSENESLTETICDVSSLSRDQITNLKVRFRGEDYDGFPNAFGYVDAIFLLLNYTLGIPRLEVELVFPDYRYTLYLMQNSTLNVNVSVYCREANCGKINATILYNQTSNYPDSPISETYGDVPIFIDENNPNSTKICSEFLQKGESCEISWTINFTGNIYTSWKIGVVVHSNLTFVKPNATNNLTVTIIPCPIDYTILFDSVDFQILNPNTKGNPAPGNENSIYNISVNENSCQLDFYIRATNLVGKVKKSVILASNMSYSNTTNNYNHSYRLENFYKLLFSNVQGENRTIYFWIDVPPIYADVYEGEIYIRGVPYGQPP